MELFDVERTLPLRQRPVFIVCVILCGYVRQWMGAGWTLTMRGPGERRSRSGAVNQHSFCFQEKNLEIVNADCTSRWAE